MQLFVAALTVIILIVIATIISYMGNFIVDKLLTLTDNLLSKIESKYNLSNKVFLSTAFLLATLVVYTQL